MDIPTNINNIINRVRKACERVNRDPEEIDIIAVSKTVSFKKI